ncbi:hypothetical protein RI845_07355 [Thalassotalea nanhaiensis]|uniref:Uncharacterized protein n=1 Tax=Thalassotalea nanhaiensis TaxID=3065648 RepID=A0ABY9TM91_9GAMM|nr:hypothetical protein RI845_07355 [Colwelliaceae bacterium SQ345]
MTPNTNVLDRTGLVNGFAHSCSTWSNYDTFTSLEIFIHGLTLSMSRTTSLTTRGNNLFINYLRGEV